MDIAISSLRVISSILLVGSFISMVWAVNHMLGYGAFVLVFIATPMVVKYLVVPWKRKNNSE